MQRNASNSPITLRITKNDIETVGKFVGFFWSNIKWLHLFIAFLHWDIFLFQAVVNIVRYLRIDLFAVKRSYLLNLYKCACSIKMHAITHSTVIVSQLVVQAAEYSYLSTNIQEKNHMMSPLWWIIDEKCYQSIWMIPLTVVLTIIIP